jgi:hypothetical protein
LVSSLAPSFELCWQWSVNESSASESSLPMFAFCYSP